ncbi:hypothetical protein GH741_20815 [Aquibacillus halophilus]|uniref:Uncharacterized protein n=1 Tax=Aquibacillus halophilus TaxID=930132 RepID=A0A6A8DPT3_9BACI|nr:hypothetical protein [Aquibacillus halophilus]MRH45087.1 hypothetical protein [Aquibacillus halophilus]
MFIAIIVLLLSLILFRFEYSQVKKLKSKKDKWTLLVGFVIGLYCAISLPLDLPVPHMNRVMDQLVGPIAKPIATMLQSFRIK